MVDPGWDICGGGGSLCNYGVRKVQKKGENDNLEEVLLVKENE